MSTDSRNPRRRATSRPDGRTLTIKAARFKDATGAYGAFTFYRDPAMKVERIGTKSASANERILFFRSNVLVDAKFDRVTGMSAAELRELAGMLPEAPATAANLPNLPEYLPKQRRSREFRKVHSRSASAGGHARLRCPPSWLASRPNPKF